MALSLRSMFGTGVARGKSANDAELEMPTTTQVKMNPPAQGYDPLGAASIMEQLRTAAAGGYGSLVICRWPNRSRYSVR